MKSVRITLSARQAREFEDLAASRGQTPARTLRVALALYAHAWDAIHGGQQVLVATRDGVPLKQLRFRRKPRTGCARAIA